MRLRLILLCALPALLLAACAEKTPATAAPKPAAAAPASSGLALRAIGTEPGWVAEVGAGAQPKISLQLDYGQRKLEVPQATVIEESNGFAGDTHDGTAVSLTYKREQCSDGMSDRDYPASVVLQVGDQQYLGCAEFPSP
ncbi:hypothetical protein [Lysobacter sp. Root690]|uniref:hypothetical protein n=1 Tax=Lysobacter sp. Root690 TaxID=1736588 RepID=UPI0006FC9ECD|nr:hypothetical protein [Lysobacter sp. Root690]KRB08715.1 hypothetical protein ASD86_05210 [Lysobacter sp. Root690]